MVQLIAGRDAAAGAVDAQDDRLDGIVLAWPRGFCFLA